MEKLIVLGGGIAGISATYHAKELGLKVSCYEKGNSLGGLVGNFSIQGFRFDNAIHLSFTSNEYVKSLFEMTDYLAHRPDAYCIEKKNWFKHPIQNNLFPLSSEEKVALIHSFTERPNFEPTNYGDWLDHQYGYAISNRYPKAYTRKYWCMEADALSTSWIGDRVRRADIKELLLGAFERRDDNHYYASEMRYPREGGYFQFIKDIAERCDIQKNKEVIEIDPIRKRIKFSDDNIEQYNSLISTLPLPQLVKMLPNVPDEVKEAARSLIWTTVDLISIGFNKPDIPPCLWYYIYDEDNLAARAYSPSWKSPDNAPAGKSSLQFEIYNLSKNIKLEPEALKENIIEKLVDTKVCNREDIIFVHHKHLPFGNVVFDHGMESRRQVVLDYLEKLNIICCGRFGEWDYLWSDQSFISGMLAVKRI